jgi:catalase
LYLPLAIHGLAGSQPWELHAEDTDFIQAGNLYRVMSEDAKQRLIDNLAAGLAVVSRQDVVERSIDYFRKADLQYGERLAKAVRASRSKKV